MFIELVKPFIEEYAKIDTITSNPTQLAFESYDPDIFINRDVITFERFKKVEVKRPVIVFDYDPTEKKERWCIDWIERTIPFISNPGYTQLLCNAKTLGGYISGGYIKKEIALQCLENAVNNNTYFNSSDSSGNIQTYHKGSKSALEAGLSEPIEWKIN